MNKKFIVVGIGEILWDMLPSGKQLGGAPANFAYYAKALGAKAYIVSRVGDDSLGNEILERLKELGFSRRQVAIDKSHPTGVVEVRLDQHGKPTYNIKENVAWDFLGMSPALLSLAKRTDAVCFGSLAQRLAVTREAIRRFIASTPQSSLKVFDINLRQSFYDRKAIHDLLLLSNVLKLNDEELLLLSRLFSLPGSESEAIKSLMRQYKLQVVALTKGPQGAVLYCPAGVYPAKGKKVRVVDTVGAGDAFTAALVMGLLNGFKMEAISRLANHLAVYVCGQEGATPGLPAELIQTIRRPKAALSRHIYKKHNLSHTY